METAQIITLTDLHQAVGDTVNRVHYGQVPLVVTKRGRPMVILIPVIGTLDEHTNIRDLVAETLGLRSPQE